MCGLGTSLASWHLWVQWGVCVLNKWLGRFSPCASHVGITHAGLVTLSSAKTQHKSFPLGRLPRVRPRLRLRPCIFIPGCLFIFPQLEPVTSKHASAFHPLNLHPDLLLEEPPRLSEEEKKKRLDTEQGVKCLSTHLKQPDVSDRVRVLRPGVGGKHK